jgi:hypothetical protein
MNEAKTTLKIKNLGESKELSTNNFIFFQSFRSFKNLSCLELVNVNLTFLRVTSLKKLTHLNVDNNRFLGKVLFQSESDYKKVKITNQPNQTKFI